MRSMLFSRLAVNNLKKNRRFFIPRILTEMGLLMCYYIISTIASDEQLRNLRGGFYLGSLLGIGVAVMAILSVILMFYTNSFLMRQRKRELGLYNILGMEKKHVRRVLFHESMISSVVSILGGCLCGILFYKAAALFVCRLLGSEAVKGFAFIKASSILRSAAMFLVIDLAAMLLNSISIARMKPVELLTSSRAGEKEPKVKWIIFIIGAATLGLGYYMALTTRNPLEAIIRFFYAVILVIAGTYCLFIAGSIFILKCLKKNEKFYFHPKHMTAVSGLMFRMKQNAVGLASTAILATGVLVMISTTVSLYVGMSDMLQKNYPDDLYLRATVINEDRSREVVSGAELQSYVEKASEAAGADIENARIERYLEVSFMYGGGRLITNQSLGNLIGLTTVDFITQDDYERMTGEALDLAADEAVIYPIKGLDSMRRDAISVGGLTLKGADRKIDYFPIRSSQGSVSNLCGIIVADDEVLGKIDQIQKEAYGAAASDVVERVAVRFAPGTDLKQKGAAVTEEIVESLHGLFGENTYEVDESLDTIWEATDNAYGLYGSLLFLGIILGIVFLFATVLIIYYKQISEGYEDQSRFKIMEKLGMSRSEIKATIRSQILLIFFLPLITAGVHISVAAPILLKMLRLMLLSSNVTFGVCTVVVFLIFAAVYAGIYIGTSKTYYRIVR